MKPLPSLRSAACLVLLSFLPLTAMLAQTDSPSPSPLPTKPVTVLATPSPSPTAVATPEATVAPGKKARTPEEKARLKAERLKKYDTNKDGKLDDQERAAMRADRERERESKATKASPQP